MKQTSKSDAILAETNQTTNTDEAKKPTLFVTIGRQRVGKTTFLKVLAEITRQQGGNPEIWNTDTMNRSNTISSLGADVLEAPSTDPVAQAAWLEERIEGMVETRRDAILDIGGGWTAIHQLIQDSPLIAAFDTLGLSLITVFMVGLETADLDYLDDMQKRDFFPSRSVIVVNEGLLPQGTSITAALPQICLHPAVEAALGSGARCASFPLINGLKKVNDRGQAFFDYANNTPLKGQPPVGVFDRLRMKRWLYRDVPTFLHQIGEDYLPDMPKGLPPIETGV